MPSVRSERLIYTEHSPGVNEDALAEVTRRQRRTYSIKIIHSASSTYAQAHPHVTLILHPESASATPDAFGVAFHVNNQETPGHAVPFYYQVYVSRGSEARACCASVNIGVVIASHDSVGRWIPLLATITGSAYLHRSFHLTCRVWIINALDLLNRPVQTADIGRITWEQDIAASFLQNELWATIERRLEADFASRILGYHDVLIQRYLASLLTTFRLEYRDALVYKVEEAMRGVQLAETDLQALNKETYKPGAVGSRMRRQQEIKQRREEFRREEGRLLAQYDKLKGLFAKDFSQRRNRAGELQTTNMTPEQIVRALDAMDAEGGAWRREIEDEGVFAMR